MDNFNQNLGNLLNKVKYPLITEKTSQLKNLNQYGFIVDRSLKKPQIKFLFEKMFNNKIISINTINLPIKTKTTKNFRGKKSLYKKVYLTLECGTHMPIFCN